MDTAHRWSRTAPHPTKFFSCRSHNTGCYKVLFWFSTCWVDSGIGDIGILGVEMDCVRFAIGWHRILGFRPSDAKKVFNVTPNHNALPPRRPLRRTAPLHLRSNPAGANATWTLQLWWCAGRRNGGKTSGAHHNLPLRPAAACPGGRRRDETSAARGGRGCMSIWKRTTTIRSQSSTRGHHPAGTGRRVSNPTTVTVSARRTQRGSGTLVEHFGFFLAHFLGM